MTRVLTIQEAADRLGVSAELMLCWLRHGEVPAVEWTDGGIRIPEDQLGGALWMAGTAEL